MKYKLNIKHIIYGLPIICTLFAAAEVPNTILFKFKDGGTQAVYTRWQTTIILDEGNLNVTSGHEATIQLPLASVAEYSFVYDPASLPSIEAGSDINVHCDGDILTVMSHVRDVEVNIVDLNGITLTTTSATAGQEATIDLSGFEPQVLIVSANDKSFKIVRR